MSSLSTLAFFIVIAPLTALLWWHKQKMKKLTANFFDDHLFVPFYSTLLVFLLTVGLLVCEVISYYRLLLIAILFCFEQSYIWLFKAWFVVMQYGPFSYGIKEKRAGNSTTPAWSYVQVKNNGNATTALNTNNVAPANSGWYTAVLVHPDSLIVVCFEPLATDDTVVVASVYQHAKATIATNCSSNDMNDFTKNWNDFLHQHWENSYGKKWIRDLIIWPEPSTYILAGETRCNSTHPWVKFGLFLVFFYFNLWNQNYYHNKYEDVVSWSCYTTEQEFINEYNFLWWFLRPGLTCRHNSKEWFEEYVPTQYDISPFKAWVHELILQEWLTVFMVMGCIWVNRLIVAYGPTMLFAGPEFDWATFLAESICKKTKKKK